MNNPSLLEKLAAYRPPMPIQGYNPYMAMANQGSIGSNRFPLGPATPGPINPFPTAPPGPRRVNPFGYPGIPPHIAALRSGYPTPNSNDMTNYYGQ